MARSPAATLRTVRDLLRYAVTAFERHGVFYGHGQPDAYDEAVFLVLRGLGLPTERLEAFLSARLLKDEIETVLELVRRRVEDKVPTAYLLGEAWQQGFRFRVDPRVLIPRSFIAELLVERMAPWIEAPERIGRVLDLCTGSGCLAILAAEAFPAAQVDAADLSPDALEVAKLNISDYRLGDRVRAVRSDVFGGLGRRRYDLIVSNPPYVTTAAMRALPPEYRHEPALALAAGDDGMDIVARILAEAHAHLKRDGLLVVEVGGERANVERRFPDLALTWLTTSGGDDAVFLVRRDELPAA